MVAGEVDPDIQCFALSVFTHPRALLLKKKGDAQGLGFMRKCLWFSGYLIKGRSPVILVEQSKNDHLRGVSPEFL
jgi:hypothetical protein